MGNYTTIVIDFETTGLSPGYGDRTIEVGAVLISNRQIVDRFQSLMNPEMRISGFIEEYTVYEVIGWRQHRGLPAMRIEKDLPDRYWFGERPRLLKDFRGEPADKLIEAVDKAAKNYPWPDTYKAFPGPNSNTFTAWIAKQVPELGLDLPFSAIGSGYADTKVQ